MLRVGFLTGDRAAGIAAIQTCAALGADTGQPPQSTGPEISVLLIEDTDPSAFAFVVGVGNLGPGDLILADVTNPDHGRIEAVHDRWHHRPLPFTNNLRATSHFESTTSEPRWFPTFRRRTASTSRSSCVTQADATTVASMVGPAGLVPVSGPWFGPGVEGRHHPEAVCVDADPGRPVSVNIRPFHAPAWRDALLLCDWLRAAADGRADYAHLKHVLAERYEHVDAYSAAKAHWVSSALSQAGSWAAAACWTP